MRFNDLIPTVLSGRANGRWSDAILWRQCVDLLAQFDRNGGEGAAELDPIIAVLQDVGARLPTDQKLSALREMGGRLTSPRLIHILLADDGPVQIMAMANARLPDDDWPAIIAKAGPLARSVLRQRPELGHAARRALEAFGAHDMSLIHRSQGTDSMDVRAHVALAEPLPEGQVASSDGEDQSQIRRIVDRIERFTSERQERGLLELVVPYEQSHEGAAQPLSSDGRLAEHPAAGAEQIEAITRLAFLTDADGVIRTVQGAPAAALAGYRLAASLLDRNVGPDGQIVGAFRRRGGFREGRLTLGEGLLRGCWLVDGDPLFDRRTGRFTGYRGVARRAGQNDMAPVVASHDGSPPEDGTSNATSLRQLIHELRTPLSGVMGFAELIENQFLGPVDDGYRTMAGQIVTDVRHLVDILDDLDLANRDDRPARTAGRQTADAAHMLADAVARFGPDSSGRQRIQLDTSAQLPPVAAGPMVAERMILHFVRALTGCVGTETLYARCRADGDRLWVEIDRPVAMAGLPDHKLFDSGVEHIRLNSDAPVLGVGFALRLVRRLAQASGGTFSVHHGHFVLSLRTLDAPAEKGLSS